MHRVDNIVSYNITVSIYLAGRLYNKFLLQTKVTFHDVHNLVIVYQKLLT